MIKWYLTEIPCTQQDTHLPYTDDVWTSTYGCEVMVFNYNNFTPLTSDLQIMLVNSASHEDIGTKFSQVSMSNHEAMVILKNFNRPEHVQA